MTATFLGLYGHASPLPTFYTEDLLEDETSDEPATRDFLDIFNHRLFALFFRCCMKYRLFFQVLEEKNAGDLERLFCLLGLGEPGLREEIPHAYSLSRYIGIVTQYPHSAWGLETMLQDAFRGVPVGVIQCFRRRVRIPPDQRLRLGQAGSRLGIDSVLGEEIEDRTGKIRLRVGPVDLATFQGLLPGSPELRQAGHADETLPAGPPRLRRGTRPGPRARPARPASGNRRCRGWDWTRGFFRASTSGRQAPPSRCSRSRIPALRLFLRC